jgi:hypothetical protein
MRARGLLPPSVTTPSKRVPRPLEVFIFFSDKLGCLGSIAVTVVGSLLLWFLISLFF